jgi:hypothetical protein
MEILINVLGWAGSFEVLLAFGLNTYQKIESKSIWYLLLNLTGGIFLIIYSSYYSAYANTFINVIWVAVAVAALIRMGMIKSKS